ncbi:uncharacterized protein LOC132162220 [Corylus avellana]|uniref:uncharacterized protein LOC132162218 n=1 Tax=Corylus avellana TaxID=13451 RepID=UPI00286C7647|nr:uncharacterized protein LOC132162218 [Corylus avellana]XP_059428466.1 uncharacterized protein LOC132162220 [Corylus avellana]
MEMHPIVGLGVKSCHPFGSQQQFNIATVQLCVKRCCLIFQFNNTDDHRSVSSLLLGFLNNNPLKILGLGIEKTLQKLEYYCQLIVDHAIDVGIFAAEKYKKPKLINACTVELVSDILEEKLPSERKMKRSKWERAKLTDDQPV